MSTIFVMVKCELGRAYEVAAAIADRVEEASEVWSTSGQYDLLVKCVLAPGRDAGHFVTESLQRLPGVRDTFTLIAFQAFR
ncbi:MAG: Lrp/AsnC ligand binding domain-containing protein [Vicinamibacteria bacterium]|jgi:DNA-binding Lrp family transcriptional regulator|nr:Lrp/AsnC ligand binding domain-containing protein [Vicinamibacteria bacterium]